MVRTKRIAIIGPEATGKTELAQTLASHFGGVSTPEYAREYFSARSLPGDYFLSRREMEELMQGQAETEARAQGTFVFVDASCFHGIIYSAMYRGAGNALHFDLSAVPRKVMDYAQQGRYDGFILCWPHEALPWESDPLRGMPDMKDRLHLAEACHYLRRIMFPDAFCIDIRGGDWQKRTLTAIDGLKKEWVHG